PTFGPLRANGFWIARDERPRPASEAVLLPCRDCKPALRPAKPRVFVKLREISVSVGLRGGPGRTRTSNQPVMDSMSLSLVAGIFGCHAHATIQARTPRAGQIIGWCEDLALPEHTTQAPRQILR